jgi:DNA-binding CsgD family transcriptional regulator
MPAEYPNLGIRARRRGVYLESVKAAVDTNGTVRQRVRLLCSAGLDVGTLERELIVALRRAVPVDAWCIGTVDPSTSMMTGSIGEGYAKDRTDRFFEIEYSEPGVNKFADLARMRPPVGRLSELAGVRKEDTSHWREICQPVGLDDELRAALVIDGACWGAMALARSRESGHFTAAEASFLAQLTETIAAGLRGSLVAGSPRLTEAAFGPGLIVLDDDLAVVATSPAGQDWLDQLRAAESEWMGPLPHVMLSAVNRLHHLEDAAADLPDLMPRLRVRLRSGQWLSVQATRLVASAAPTQIAIIIEPSGPTEIAPLILQAYALSAREREVAGHVLRGQSTQEIAEELVISPHTVHQHLKSIYKKVGIQNRAELVSEVFDRHYRTPLLHHEAVGADGRFLAVR